MAGVRIKISIKKKLVFLIIFIVVSVIAVAGFFSYRNLTLINEAMYLRMSKDLAGTGAAMLDPAQVKEVRDRVMEIYNSIPEDEKVSTDEYESDEILAYLDHFSEVEKMQAYKDIMGRLRTLQDHNELHYVYLVTFDTRKERTIYLVDASYDEYCPPGAFDPVMYDVDKEAVKNPSNGIAADITNTEEYGWAAAAGGTVFYEEKAIAFVGAEIDMNDVVAQRNQFFAFMSVILLILGFATILLSVFLIDRMIVRPINKLSDTSTKYWSGGNGGVRHEFSQLCINTGDEIETLTNSMKQMEQNINDHITKILETTQEMIEAQEHAAEMDRAANIDAMTKVRNNRAYIQDLSRLNDGIKNGNVDFGILMIDLNYLKKTNDEYGHDKGNESLRLLCRIICTVFKHSPVFRIGGDEFVVILEGHDLENREELVAEFDEAIEKCQLYQEPWRRISAAKGAAIFIPGLDYAAEDVFKRADVIMYDNKKAMKAVRKD